MMPIYYNIILFVGLSCLSMLNDHPHKYTINDNCWFYKKYYLTILFGLDPYTVYLSIVFDHMHCFIDDTK